MDWGLVVNGRPVLLRGWKLLIAAHHVAVQASKAHCRIACVDSFETAPLAVRHTALLSQKRLSHIEDQLPKIVVQASNALLPTLARKVS